MEGIVKKKKKSLCHRTEERQSLMGVNLNLRRPLTEGFCGRERDKAFNLWTEAGQNVTFLREWDRTLCERAGVGPTIFSMNGSRQHSFTRV